MKRAVLALVLVASACAEPPPRELVLRAAGVHDGAGGPPLGPTLVHVVDGVISAMRADTPDAALPPGARVVDARGALLIPGLVRLTREDCLATADPESLHALLQAGVTTLASVSADVVAAAKWRKYVGTARHRGPRIVVAGPPVASVDEVLAQSAAGADVLTVSFSGAEASCPTVRAAREQDVPVIAVDGMPDEATACGATSTRRWASGAGCGAEAIDLTRLPENTIAAAAILGLGEALGRVAVGYRADLLGLENGIPRLVIIDGVVQDLEGPGLVSKLAALARHLP